MMVRPCRGKFENEERIRETMSAIGNEIVAWMTALPYKIDYSTTRATTAALSVDDDSVDKQQEQRAVPVTVTRSRVQFSS